MMKHPITRIYEIVVLLIVLGCLGQILWDTPTYDLQLGDLQTAMKAIWQQGHKKAGKAMENLKEDVHKNGNSREGRERIKRAQLLIKKTTKLNGLFERTNNQWHNGKQGFDALKKALKKHTDWINSEFNDLDLAPVDPKHTLAKYPHRSNATTIATKALIAEKKLQIQRLQAMILRKLGAGDLSVSISDRYFRPGVIPTLNQIQVGDRYQADMILSGTASRSIPRFSIYKIPLPVNEGKSEVIFKTQGVGKQYWEARFRFNSRGKDITIVQKVYYEVLPQGNKQSKKALQTSINN
ncbi:hypothetical protein [Microscilla marina]|uniref:Gliding motility-associated protein GldM first immunoglobulin-like domain-containing protein n=1 Tax=Microscilla marina ATCC 23134 TaxID=313606 RepID=A1ZLA8_MICM2|nr:hypothetical protein [Microscilla marina]EAY28662.1 hypothetical protein M23134_07760 [Microscilla marina ATCC 23134]